MADAAPADRGGFRGGFGGRGRGGGRGDRGGRGRGRGRGGRGGRGKEEKEWIPVTKLGRLVKDGKIKSLEEIYLFSLPIKVSSKREPAWDSKFRIIGHCLIRNNPKFLKAKIPINFHLLHGKTYKATRLSLIVRNLLL